MPVPMVPVFQVERDRNAWLMASLALAHDGKGRTQCLLEMGVVIATSAANQQRHSQAASARVLPLHAVGATCASVVGFQAVVR